MITRRSVLIGLVAAPVIVRFSSLMPVRPPKPDFVLRFYNGIELVDKLPVLDGLDLIRLTKPFAYTPYWPTRLTHFAVAENKPNAPDLWVDHGRYGNGWYLAGGDTLMIHAPVIRLT